MSDRVTEQLEAFPPSRPVARSTDPGTSWAAARSVDSDLLKATQKLICEVLRPTSGLTDPEILERVNDLARRRGYPQVSPSGCRTRRAELVRFDLVYDTGRRATLPSGRKAVVWSVF